MNSETKTAIYGFALAGLLFWGLTTVFKKKDEVPGVLPTAEGIDVAIKAYSAALAANEDLAALNELNDRLMAEFGVRVGLNKESHFVVTNYNGTVIKTIAA